MARKQKKIEAWFPWENDPDKARVNFALIIDDDRVAIEEKASVSRQYFDPETRQFKAETVINRRLDREETALAAVKEWENFFDPDGKPMECNEKNIRSWASDNGFMALLRQSQQKLEKQALQEATAAEKN